MTSLDDILRRNPDLKVQRIDGKLVESEGKEKEVQQWTPDIPAHGPGTWNVRTDLSYPQRPEFRSKTEGRAWDWLAGAGNEWLWIAYEPLVFHLPSGNYTPDIGIWTHGGAQVMIEVKSRMGFKGHISGRSAKRAMREAAAHFSFAYYFVSMIEGRSGGWKFQMFHHTGKISKPTTSLDSCLRQYGEPGEFEDLEEGGDE